MAYLATALVIYVHLRRDFFSLSRSSIFYFFFFCLTHAHTLFSLSPHFFFSFDFVSLYIGLLWYFLVIIGSLFCLERLQDR